MSNPTTPFSWQMPTATDLVTDLPADFEVFGQAVATSMGDLLGGASGYILSKASATDMDFTWIANDQGDITGVTAGTGISGGGTSGTVTVTNSMATAITTAGDVIYGTGSGTFTRLGIGTAGQVLTVNGGATAPLWAAASTGGMTLLSTTSLSGASTTISSISGAYTNLQIFIKDYLPSVDSASMYIRFNGDTGSNYVSGGTGFPSPAATTFVEVAAGIDNAVTENFTAINLFDYANSNTHKVGQFTGLNNIYTGSNYIVGFGMLGYKSTTAISSLTVLPSSGTLTGTVLIYGVK